MQDDMLDDFYVEAQELFDEAEDSLLSIEKTDDFDKCFNSIFRTFHSIKGAAGMFGIDKLQEHMHFVENLLEQKKHLKTMSMDTVDYMLNAVDSARKMLKGEEVEFKYFDPDEAGHEQIQVTAEDQKLTDTLKKQIEKKVNIKPSEGVIFVVDDEPGILEIVTEFLSDENYTVHTYTNAKVALEELSEKKPDLIITDIKMPEMNGIELMQEVNKRKPHLPVIVVSGQVTKDVCMNSMICGISGILEKPFDPTQMIGMLEVAINKYNNIKLLNKSIDLLVYQFEDFDKYLASVGSESKRESFRTDLKNILKQKKLLFDRLN